MSCRICKDVGKEYSKLQCLCICGYCPDCIKKYGHDECHKITTNKEVKEHG